MSNVQDVIKNFIETESLFKDAVSFDTSLLERNDFSMILTMLSENPIIIDSTHSVAVLTSLGKTIKIIPAGLENSETDQQNLILQILEQMENIIKSTLDKVGKPSTMNQLINDVDTVLRDFQSRYGKV